MVTRGPICASTLDGEEAAVARVAPGRDRRHGGLDSSDGRAMSKEAAVRAMREARYRERSTTSTPAPSPARPTKPQAASPAAPAPPPTEALCGHRSMNGRTCTRERDHAAKSHRYS